MFAYLTNNQDEFLVCVSINMIQIHIPGHMQPASLQTGATFRQYPRRHRSPDTAESSFVQNLKSEL